VVERELGDQTIVLRVLELDDADEWLAGEDDEQIRWFEFPRPATRDDVVSAIERWRASWQSEGPVRQWAVCERATGAIAGGVEVRDLGDRTVNLSYVVFPAFRRRGVATRASRLALAHAARELGARTAVIKVLAGNAASHAVARRLGATRRGSAASEHGSTFIVYELVLAVDEHS
jgi:RimJ/RimL family protein N-acetyltransferase